MKFSPALSQNKISDCGGLAISRGNRNMTGDGSNDAPVSSLGIAISKGEPRRRAAAGMVLLDDNLP